MSQHLDSIKLFNSLRNHPVTCHPTLGVQFLNILKGASPGAGGAILLSAEINGEPVVIKAFPTDCPVKYFKGNRQMKKKNIYDYGDYEPGTGLMLTEQLIINHITQNIVTCYNISICEYAYNTNISMCSRKNIPSQSSYPIPTIDDCKLMAETEKFNPLCAMNNIYYSVVTTDLFELPERDDMVRFMMVEKCAGDIQGLIESYNSLDYSQILYLINNLYLMCLMIVHTLILFDCILDGYTHKDLGARNVLYTWDLHQSPNKFWRYNFPTNNGIVSIDIPTSTLIPKIWDFANVRFGNADIYTRYYAYLDPITTPTLQQIKYENRQNDIYVLLSDINDLLIKNGISNTPFNKLDLNKIRNHNNNTAAIYEFLSQYPIPNSLLENPTHDIIHTFPPDNSIFNTFRIDRNVLA